MGYQKYETLSDHIPRSGIYTLTNDLECKKGIFTKGQRVMLHPSGFKQSTGMTVTAYIDGEKIEDSFILPFKNNPQEIDSFFSSHFWYDAQATEKYKERCSDRSKKDLSYAKRIDMLELFAKICTVLGLFGQFYIIYIRSIKWFLIDGVLVLLLVGIIKIIEVKNREQKDALTENLEQELRKALSENAG